MAKLGSSSCRPLLQGTTMLLALLLLASIQAGPVMAGAGPGQIFGELVEKGSELGKNVKDTFADLVPHKQVAEKIPETAGKTFFNAVGRKPGWEAFSKGGKKGMKVYKYSCKALVTMEKQNTGGAGGSGIGIGIGNGVVLCRNWFTQPQPQGTAATTTLVHRYPDDGRYYVRMTGIWVGGVRVVLTSTAELLLFTPPGQLSTTGTQPVYTYIESSQYGGLLDAVIQQTNWLNRWAQPSPIITDNKQMCYAAAALSVPPQLPVIAIRLASNNAMRPMELGGQVGNVWYRDESAPSSRICLGILPVPATMGAEPVLGSMIQIGKTMTIGLTAAGGLGLTF